MESVMKGAKPFLSTKEVAQFLGINEKMVYSLVADKGLPATKVTGKWLFPLHLVEQWLENATINYPKAPDLLPPYHGLLIISGSNDILLDRTMTLFHNQYPENIPVFGNLGSMGGIRALRQNLCHIASSHLIQDDEQEYNFGIAREELGQLPAVINFCRREQGLIVAKGNPKEIESVADLAKSGVTIVNRPLGTGTRLLMDRELAKADVSPQRVKGYGREFQRHLDVGLEVLSGRADAGPAIRAVSGLLGLDFIPLRWERFDLMVRKERFFDKGVQLFLGLLHEPEFHALCGGLEGYDRSLSGKMVYPAE
jgi:excisionase family DNA binding protein